MKFFVWFARRYSVKAFGLLFICQLWTWMNGAYYMKKLHSVFEKCYHRERFEERFTGVLKWKIVILVCATILYMLLVGFL